MSIHHPARYDNERNGKIRATSWDDAHTVTPDGDFVYLTESRSVALTDHDKILIYKGNDTIVLSPVYGIYPSFVIQIPAPYTGTVEWPGESVG